MVDLGFIQNPNNTNSIASGFSKILKNNPLTSGQTKSTNSLLSQVKNIVPVSDMGKEEQPQMEAPQGEIPSYLGNLKNSSMFLKDIPEIKSTIPNYIKPSGAPIAGVNSPIMGSQFGTPIGAEKTQISNMSDEAKQGIKSEVATMNFKRKDLEDLKLDVDAGMPMKEMGNLYPEIPETIRQDLYADIQAGIPLQDVGTYYPELKGVGGIQASEVEGKNPLVRATGAARGAVKGAGVGLYEGVVPGFQEMVKDSKRILADNTKSAPEKFNQILYGEFVANYLGGIIGDTVGGAVGGLYDGFTTETERKFVNQHVKNIFEDMINTAKTNPDINGIMTKYNKLDNSQKQELNDLISYAVDATNFIGAKELAQPAISAGKSILESGIEGVSKLTGVADDILAKLPKKAITSAEKQAIVDATPTMAGKMVDNLHGFTKSEIRKYNAEYGETPGQTLNNEGLIANTEETLNTKIGDFQKFKSDKKAALSAIEAKVPVDEDVIQMAKEVAAYEKTSALPSEIKSGGGNRKKYDNLVTKAENGELSHVELDDLKSNFERNQTLKYDASRTTVDQARLENLDSSIRKKQQTRAAENGFNNIKDINQQISKSKAIIDLLAKDVEKVGDLSFSDYIVLAESVVNPQALVVLAGKKVSQTAWFKRGLIKMLNRINGKKTVLEKVADLRKIGQMNTQTEFEKFIKQGELKTPALPYNEAVANAPKTNIVGGEKIAVTPEGQAVREGQILEKNPLSLQTTNATNTPINSNSRGIGSTTKVENPLANNGTNDLTINSKFPIDNLPARKNGGTIRKNPLAVKKSNANFYSTPVVTREALIADIPAYLEGDKEFATALDEIKGDGTVLHPNIKILNTDGSIRQGKSNNGAFQGIDRILQKSDSKGLVNDKDVIRATILKKSGKGITEMKAVLEKDPRFKAIEYKNPKDSPRGYGDINAIYTTKNGKLAEIQVNTYAMQYGKDGFGVPKDIMKLLKEKTGLEPAQAHIWYDRGKAIDAEMAEGNFANLQELLDIQKKSKEYFGKLQNVVIV